jgi:hypothetical protein
VSGVGSIELLQGAEVAALPLLERGSSSVGSTELLQGAEVAALPLLERE